MPHAPRRRDVPAKSPKRGRLTDVDAADRLVRLKALLWGGAMGFFGGPIGAGVAMAAGGNPLIGAAVGLLVGLVGVPSFALWITRSAAHTIQQIHAPSGGTTPYKRQYSYAESLVKRGAYGEAAAAYELYTLEQPGDPEPYLRLARLCRDQLNQHEDAVTWFSRARANAVLSAGQQTMVIQETVDIYIRRLKRPRKAIPELSLLVERFPGTPAAEAAARELAEMREMLERERDQMIPFTLQYLKKVARGSVAEAAAQAAAELEQFSAREVLADCGGDKAKAAERLGVTVDELNRVLA